jgi:hypothetical protein
MELFLNIDFAFIGGLLLLIGAILISEYGKIYLASVLYLLADICWIIIAFKNSGLQFESGVIMVILGTLFGLRTFIKMHKNIYHRNLHKG